MAIKYLDSTRIRGSGSDKDSLVTAAGWTAQANLNTGRKFGGGGGTKTSAIVFGGSVSGGKTATTETFNGSTWTISTSTSSQPPSMDAALSDYNGGGNASNAISVGGYNASSANVNTTETYAGGTAWAAAANHPTTLRAHGCDGNSVNALSCGGYVSAYVNATHTYLGSGDAWTTQSDTLGFSGQAEYGGTALRGIRVGGYSGSYLATAETWSYDGSGTDGTWTSIANILEEGRERTSIAGNDTNAVWAGGWEDDFTYYTKCNTWNGTAWAVGAPYPVATGSTHSGTGGEQASAGTKDGAMFCGGNATIVNCYSWADSASSDLPENTIFEQTNDYKSFFLKSGEWKDVSSISKYGSSAIQTAGVYSPASGANQTWVTTGNGTWVAGADTVTTQGYSGGGGNGDSAIIFGGDYGGSFATKTEIYNGYGWRSNVDTLTTGRSIFSSGGNVSDAWGAGGWASGQLTSTEEWDGTEWSTGGTMLGSNATRSSYGDGLSVSAITAGGNGQAGLTTNTIATYDGVSWRDAGNLTYATLSMGLAGSQIDMIAVGGQNSSNNSTNYVQLWDGSSITLGTALTTNRYSSPCGGTSSNCIAIAGYVGANYGTRSATTVWYDGTTWQDSGNLPEATNDGVGASNT